MNEKKTQKLFLNPFFPLPQMSGACWNETPISSKHQWQDQFLG